MANEITKVTDQNGVDHPFKDVAAFPRSEQAVLGAVNLNLLDLATIKSLNTTGTWSGNAYTENNVTFTIGDDFSIDIDGTPSASTTLRLSSGASAKAGSYIWGSTDNPVNNKIYLTAQIGSTNYDAVFSAKEVPVVLANDVSNLQTRVYVGSGIQFDHVKVYPMLSLSGGSYVPPAMTNKELTENKYGLNKTLDTTDDLDNVKEKGIYIIKGKPINAPENASYAMMIVSPIYGDGSLPTIQTIFMGNNIYSRTYSGSPIKWNSWYKYTGTAV